MTTAWRYSGSDSVYDCNGDSGRSNDDGIAIHCFTFGTVMGSHTSLSFS